MVEMMFSIRWESDCDELSVQTREQACSLGRFFVVHRFKIESGQLNRHIFVERCRGHVQSGELVYDDQEYLCADVKSTALVTASRETRGPQSCAPISSFGALPTGAPYLISRFSLYWDVYILQDTSEDSAEGLYLVPMNLQPRVRNSQHSVRVCDVSPPGMKVDALFERLADDIGRGGALEVMDFDATGT